MSAPPRDEVFVSYSHKDAKFVDELLMHLKPLARLGHVTKWSDKDIAPGSKWFDEIQTAFAAAKVAVLMVSPDFLASDFIQEHELGPFAKQAAATDVRILWVPVRASMYSATPLRNYQSAISPDRPLAEMKRGERDSALVSICQKIASALASSADASRPTSRSVHRASLTPIELLASPSHLLTIPDLGIFEGRDAEMDRLDAIWNDPRTHILTMVAPAGAGKTTLIARWGARLLAQPEHGGVERYFDWQFVDSSSDEFFTHAVKFFRPPNDTRELPLEKSGQVALLAEWVGQYRTLLVLDNIDLLQHPPGLEDRTLADAALAALFIELAKASRGLCLIATRHSVNELNVWRETTVEELSLGPISDRAGAAVLRKLGVHGPQAELELTSRELGGSVLALRVMGEYLKQPRRPLNEAKLILVGRGGVGKTCLIKRLIDNTFNPNEQETPGIEIRPWLVKLSDGIVWLRVWDFGGQEILHATHQFFLTERTLYLLVLSGREGDPTRDAEYWLQLIKSFGGDSRVLIVLNKMNQHSFDVNRGLLLEKYRSIAGFVSTDCEDGTGVRELKQRILHQTESLEHRKKDFPSRWFDIKDRLAGMPESFLNWDQYQEICCELGEPDAKAQRDLAGYLHVLGIALNYSKDPHLQKTHVLNPRWVTEGIYTLLRNGQEQRREGVLRRVDIADALDSQRYPATSHDFLLRLMMNHQLCFRLPGNEERYLVPELLGENQPALKDLMGDAGLGFRYQYEVLPEGMLPRFIVQTHLLSEANPHWRWRTGVVLHRDGCRAVVRADPQKHCVNIYVTGSETQRRGLLAIIREKFDEQHSDLKGLKVDERVPIPSKPGVTVSYHHLLMLEEQGQEWCWPEGVSEPLRVVTLLNGVELAEARARRRDVQADNSRGAVAGSIETYPEAYVGDGMNKEMSMTGKALHVSNLRGKVHAAIITIRHDEYDAMEACLGTTKSVSGGNNNYECATIAPVDGDPLAIVLTRVVSQGNTPAQAVASNIIHELDPSWLILVGIAGGVPDSDFSLGDLVVASYLHDFSLQAAIEGKGHSFQSSGGPMHQDVERFLQTKIVGRHRERLLELAGFLTDTFPAPPHAFKPTDEGMPPDHLFYGSEEFKSNVRDTIVRRFPQGQRTDHLRVVSGACGNGNVLMKDTQLLQAWRQSARQLIDVETELAGVYAAARSAGRQNYPVLAIRGLSDIVGFKRDPAWTAYACQTAAAFTHAVLQSGFINFAANLPPRWPF